MLPHDLPFGAGLVAVLVGVGAVFVPGFTLGSGPPPASPSPPEEHATNSKPTAKTTLLSIRFIFVDLVITAGYAQLTSDLSRARAIRHAQCESRERAKRPWRFP